MRGTSIEWADHTFNPWRGCTKVSPGCAHCYAEAMSRRNPAVLGVWGQTGTRVVASKTMWREPLRWNREAAARGVRQRVFCASLADVFEGRDSMSEESWVAVTQARVKLGSLIAKTPNLDWLLLTKRPENVLDIAQDIWFRPWLEGPLPDNVWLGTSVEDQQRADERIPRLLAVSAKVRWLSCEPLLGPVDLRPYLTHSSRAWPNGAVNWVVVGGESGQGSRPFRREWADSLVRQCQVAGVACFVKQLGANYADEINGVCGKSTIWPLDVLPSGPTQRLSNPKGGDWDEWPDSLRVRQFPFGVHP